MRAKNFLGTLIPLAEAEAFDRLGNILHPRKQLLKLRGREPSPEGVEFETRNQPRSRAYDLGDHGVINWAIIGDVTGEVNLVVKHDVEESDNISCCRRGRAPDLRNYRLDIEQEPCLPLAQRCEGGASDPNFGYRQGELMVFVLELRPSLVQRRD